MGVAPRIQMNWSGTGFESFLDHWRSLKAGKDVPDWHDWQPADLVPLLGSVNAISVVDGGKDFLFRVYGTRHVDSLDIEMTGKSVGDMTDRARSQRSFALYRQVFLSRLPHCTFYRIEAMDSLALKYSRDHVYLLRLVVPFTTGSGEVDRLLGYGEPVTTAMLDSYFGPSRPPDDTVACVR